MTDRPPQLFTAIDSLLAAVDEGTVLPLPAERVRLREAADLTEAAVAQAVGVRATSIAAWEAGRAEPKGERLEACRRLLEGLSHRYPATTAPPAPAPRAVPSAASPEQSAPTTHPGSARSTGLSGGPSRVVGTAGRRPSVPPASCREAARTDIDPGFLYGPLAVLDGDGGASGTGGIILD